MRKCPSCKMEFPASKDFFYLARPSGRHKTPYFTYCKSCWKQKNAENKLRRKLSHLVEILA